MQYVLAKFRTGKLLNNKYVIYDSFVSAQADPSTNFLQNIKASREQTPVKQIAIIGGQIQLQTLQQVGPHHTRLCLLNNLAFGIFEFKYEIEN